jgi:hypothetical protein
MTCSLTSISTNVRCSDACHRLVPIERVCAASEGDIVSTAQALIPAHFPQETETPSKVRQSLTALVRRLL